MTVQQYDNWIAEIRGDEKGSTDQAINQMSMSDNEYLTCEKEYITAIREAKFDLAEQLKQHMEEIKLKRAININIQQSQPREDNVKTRLVSTKEFVSWAKAKRRNYERKN